MKKVPREGMKHPDCTVKVQDGVKVSCQQCSHISYHLAKRTLKLLQIHRPQGFCCFFDATAFKRQNLAFKMPTFGIDEIDHKWNLCAMEDKNACLNSFVLNYLTDGSKGAP